MSNWNFINFVISFQHYPGKVKINLHIPNSSPDILNIKSSPSSISPGGGNSIHIGLKKYSPVNGDTSTSADKKKISISLPLTPPAPPAAPAVSAPLASAPAPPPVTSVSIYIKVNRSRCNNLGPYLDPKKVSDQLPEQVSLFHIKLQWGRSMILFLRASCLCVKFSMCHGIMHRSLTVPTVVCSGKRFTCSGN